VGDLVRVQVESASLVALRGVEQEVVDPAPAIERTKRTRLTVLSA
jgi:hypothetical protein